MEVERSMVCDTCGIEKAESSFPKIERRRIKLWTVTRCTVCRRAPKLNDAYMCRLLGIRFSFFLSLEHQQMIALKREEIELSRLTRQLKTELNSIIEKNLQRKQHDTTN
jgi:hypothetical protein